MIYPTLPDAAKHALDVYDEAVVLYAWSHSETHRIALESAREAMLREVTASARRATMESDEAAANLNLGE